ncbi:hypothetical protein IAU60_001334 [Kwoniella sp. DSM 27419]
MAPIPLITTALKGFAAFWSLVLWAVAASFIAKSNAYFGTGPVNGSNFAAGNALIAAGLLSMLYFIASLVLIFRAPAHFLISVMMDAIVLGIFFIFFLASTAALSTEASFFSRWNSTDTWASLGSAAVGLGWVMTFLVLGILLFEVVYTIMHFGRDRATWRTPFNQLAAYGSPSTGSASTAVPMSTVPPSGTSGATTQQVSTAPAPAVQSAV